jgi:hypothetical protein
VVVPVADTLAKVACQVVPFHQEPLVSSEMRSATETTLLDMSAVVPVIVPAQFGPYLFASTG